MKLEELKVEFFDLAVGVDLPYSETIAAVAPLSDEQIDEQIFTE